jgi:hypothetical protein
MSPRDVTDVRPEPVPVDRATADQPHDERGDESWATPRGPHFPDALRIVPPAAWIFVGLAVARLAWALRQAELGPILDPWRVGQVVWFSMPSVISILLPAALLTRHRDAPTRLKTIFAGMVLLALVEGLRVLGSPLEPVFEWLTPTDPSVGFLVPSAVVYQVTINLLNALAVAAVASGLQQARRFEDRVSSWPVAAVMAGLVVLVAVTGIVSVSRLPGDQLPLTATIVAYIVSTVALNVLSAAAFGYLAATTTAGARAGEDPSAAWYLGASGSLLVIGSLAALGLSGLVETTPEVAGLKNNVVLGIETVFSLGFVGLLAAFLAGLPWLERVGEEGEREDEPIGDADDDWDDTEAMGDDDDGDGTVEDGDAFPRERGEP